MRYQLDTSVMSLKCSFSGKDRSAAFRALIVLFSYGYNKEKCKIIEATFLTLHFFAICEIFRRLRGGMAQVAQW